MYCYNCGNKMEETDKFCVKCGASISKEEKQMEQPTIVEDTHAESKESNKVEQLFSFEIEENRNQRSATSSFTFPWSRIKGSFVFGYICLLLVIGIATPNKSVAGTWTRVGETIMFDESGVVKVGNSRANYRYYLYEGNVIEAWFGYDQHYKGNYTITDMGTKLHLGDKEYDRESYIFTFNKNDYIMFAVGIVFLLYLIIKQKEIVVRSY